MAHSEFKHISVSTADEDDEVIVAGMTRPEPARAGASPAPVPESSLELQPEPEPQSEPDPKSEQERGSSAASVQSGKRVDGAGRADSDGYRQTTLDDLKGEPMSLTQKVVIIAAIICIIGAIVYYCVFMR